MAWIYDMIRIKESWRNPDGTGWGLTWLSITISVPAFLSGMTCRSIMWKRRILRTMNSLCMPTRIRMTGFMTKTESLWKNFLRVTGIRWSVPICPSVIPALIPLFRIISISTGGLFRLCVYRGVSVIPGSLTGGICLNLRNHWITVQKRIRKRRGVIIW